MGRQEGLPKRPTDPVITTSPKQLPKHRHCTNSTRPSSCTTSTASPNTECHTTTATTYRTSNATAYSFTTSNVAPISTTFANDLVFQWEQNTTTTRDYISYFTTNTHNAQTETNKTASSSSTKESRAWQNRTTNDPTNVSNKISVKTAKEPFTDAKNRDTCAPRHSNTTRDYIRGYHSPQGDAEGSGSGSTTGTRRKIKEERTNHGLQTAQQPSS
jgi:hypothetical protein